MNNLDRSDLWRTRLYYLLSFGGGGFASPFMTLFYIQLGLTGTQIGAVASMAAVVTLVAAPFWTSRDWNKPRRMMQFFIIFNALGFFLLSQQVFFLGVAAASIFRAFVMAGIMPLSDSLALTVTRNAHTGFGSVRVFGSLGWVIFVLLSGLVAEHLGLKFSLIGAAILTFTSAVILLTITPSNFSIDKTKTPVNIRWVMHKLADNPLMMGISLMIVIMGLGNSGVLQFEGTYLRQLGARESLIGMSGMLGAVIELPCMFWADHLMKKRSAYRLLLMAMLVYFGLRIFVLAVPSVPTIMFAQAAGGVAFSFFTVSLVRFIGEQTEPGETRMMLAFFTVTLTSLTSIVGSPLAGAFYDRFGPHWLYGIAACGYLLAWVNLQIASRMKVRSLEAATQK